MNVLLNLSLSLVDLVEAYRDYNEENLMTLGRALDLPHNDNKMQVSAVLRASVTWYGRVREEGVAELHRQQRLARDAAMGVVITDRERNISVIDQFGEEDIIASEMICIPICCTLAYSESPVSSFRS